MVECYKAGYFTPQDLIGNFQKLNTERDATARDRIAVLELEPSRAGANWLAQKEEWNAQVAAMNTKHKSEGRDIGTIDGKLASFKSSIREMSGPEARALYAETAERIADGAKPSTDFKQKATEVLDAGHAERVAQAVDGLSNAKNKTDIGSTLSKAWSSAVGTVSTGMSSMAHSMRSAFGSKSAPAAPIPASKLSGAQDLGR